jgi:hypothetical protein
MGTIAVDLAVRLPSYFPFADSHKEQHVLGKARSLVLAAVLATTVAVGFALSVGTASAAPQPTATNTFTNIPVQGQCEDATTGVEGTFSGVLAVAGFTTSGNRILAQGTVSGTCSVGGTITDAAVTAPVRIAQATTCDVLTLVLGPLHLDLLGLVIDLNQVVLNITADAGGGLLGSLLCSLAGGGGGNPLQTIVDLLNQILGILSGL